MQPLTQQTVIMIMDDRAVIVVDGSTALARHLEQLGVKVYAVGSKLSEVQGTVLAEGEAICWDMKAVVSPNMRSLMRRLLLSVPRDCIRILDFNLKDINEERLHLITLSLKCCDLLKIDVREFSGVCSLLGLVGTHVFDDGFELMKRFRIDTLVLTRGTRGCHVFHGNAVSEKWGYLPFADCTQEEAEGAFTAAYFAVSQESAKLFTDYHKQALDYLKHVCKPKR